MRTAIVIATEANAGSAHFAEGDFLGAGHRYSHGMIGLDPRILELFASDQSPWRIKRI
jgi:hypothetical protein